MDSTTLFTIIAIVGVVIFIAMYVMGRKKGGGKIKQRGPVPPKPSQPPRS